MDGPVPDPSPKLRRAAAALGPCVPDDAILEIFKLLPARSLHQFKCVSKAWCAMVTDPLRRHHFAQTLAGFLYLPAQVAASEGGNSSGDRVCERCRDGDGGDESSYRPCRHALICTRRFINVSGMAEPLIDPAFPFLPPVPAPPGGEKHRDVILDSCDGLILLGRFRWDETPRDHLPICYLVCNPTTAQTAVVPDHGGGPLYDSEEPMVHTYLLFDDGASPDGASPDQFHLLQFWEQDGTGTMLDLFTYSSAEGKWTDRFMELGENGGSGWEFWGRGFSDEELIRPGTGSAVVNGMLHLVVDPEDDNDTDSLVAVDGLGRVMRMLHVR